MSVQASDQEWWRPRPQQAEAPAAVQAVAGPREESPDSPVPFWLLMLFTFILLLSPQSIYPALEPFRIAMLAGGAALAAHVVTRIARGLPLITFPHGMVYLLLLLGWAMMTVPLSLWPGASVSFLLSEYSKPLVVLFLLPHVVSNLRRMRIVFWGLTLMAVPQAWTVVKNYLTGVYFEFGRVMGYDSPLTWNPNDQALMLNLLLPFVIALFFNAEKRLHKLLLGGVIVLLVAGVIVTFSRAGFLTLGVIFLIYLWRLRNRRERIWAPLALVLALASLPFLPDSYTERLATITDFEEDASGSAQTRWSDMWAGAGYVLDNPVTGGGIGQNILAMNDARGETWLEIHNVYLMVAVELGLPGLVLFLLLYGACFRHTRETLQACAGGRGGQATLYYMSEGIRISLIAFAVQGFFHPVAYHFYFYYLAGLAMALPGLREADARTGAIHGNDQQEGS